jgi:hypothetical protein
MRVVIAEEYDLSKLKALKAILKKLGAKKVKEWNGLGGSQEIQHFEYKLRDNILIVEAETYMGLSIEGDESLINHVLSCLD